ncbi:GNAT family N-acetyltransferase [Streptomyces cellulosae]
MLELRTAEADDWPLRRELRLAARAEAPYAFGPTPAQWQGSGDREERGRARLSTPGAHDLVALLDGLPVGMAGGVPGGGAEDVELISMWVDPMARGKGVGDYLIQAVERWAAERGATTLRLSVMADNAGRPRSTSGTFSRIRVSPAVFSPMGWAGNGSWRRAWPPLDLHARARRDRPRAQAAATRGRHCRRTLFSPRARARSRPCGASTPGWRALVRARTWQQVMRRPAPHALHRRRRRRPPSRNSAPRRHRPPLTRRPLGQIQQRNGREIRSGGPRPPPLPGASARRLQ